MRLMQIGGGWEELKNVVEEHLKYLNSSHGRVPTSFGINNKQFVYDYNEALNKFTTRPNLPHYDTQVQLENQTGGLTDLQRYKNTVKNVTDLLEKIREMREAAREAGRQKQRTQPLSYQPQNPPLQRRSSGRPMGSIEPAPVFAPKQRPSDRPYESQVPRHTTGSTFTYGADEPHRQLHSSDRPVSAPIERTLREQVKKQSSKLNPSKPDVDTAQARISDEYGVYIFTSHDLDEFIKSKSNISISNDILNSLAILQKYFESQESMAGPAPPLPRELPYQLQPAADPAPLRGLHLDPLGEQRIEAARSCIKAKTWNVNNNLVPMRSASADIVCYQEYPKPRHGDPTYQSTLGFAKKKGIDEQQYGCIVKWNSALFEFNGTIQPSYFEEPLQLYNLLKPITQFRQYYDQIGKSLGIRSTHFVILEHINTGKTYAVISVHVKQRVKGMQMLESIMRDVVPLKYEHKYTVNGTLVDHVIIAGDFNMEPRDFETFKVKYPHFKGNFNERLLTNRFLSERRDTRLDYILTTMNIFDEDIGDDIDFDALSIFIDEKGQPYTTQIDHKSVIADLCD